MKRYLTWSLVMVPAFLPAIGQTVNPANQINWPLVTGSGAPTAACTAANYGQPYTDISANKGYTCTPSGWVQTGGGGTSAFTSNIGVGANGSSAYAPVNEVNYKTTSGNTAFACQEDQNKGVWDVRCIRGGVSWATNPSQALINTIQAAECYHFVGGGPSSMTVQLPAGSYSLGGSIQVPPGVDVEGVGGTQFGILTQLTTNDPTQPMLVQASSETFTCSGTNYTVSAGTTTVGNLSLLGAGATNKNDIGLVTNTGGASIAYIHNINFQNQGGPGRTLVGGANGQGSRGSNIFAAVNLQWYYNSGAYNTSSFADTTPHCSLELGDLDARWDHLEVTGQQPDSGWFNRYYLSNVCLGGGGQNDKMTDSYLQLAPHNVWMYSSANGGQQVLQNRMDFSWWDSIHILSPGDFSDNNIIGYCASPTLNPSNFASNPGGVSTDPNCAAIEVVALGSSVRHNSIGAGVLFAQWPIWSVYTPENTTGAPPSIIEEGAGIGPWIGGAPLNPGADVTGSMLDITNYVQANVGAVIHFNNYRHVYLNDTTPQSYSDFDGLYNDAYVTINLSANDTITNSGRLQTCGGGNITGGGNTWWWEQGGVGLIQMACPSGGGGGGGGSISGLTAGFIPLAGSTTSLTANSPLDYNISNTGVVTSSKPFSVNDGTGLAGLFDGTEGTPPSGAANHDILWADATSHRLSMNNNNTGKVIAVGIATAGVAGDAVHLASNGIDLVDAGTPPSSQTPTFTAGTGAGTGPTISLTAGANDDSGWINVTTGTSPAASAGVVTINYGGTYANIRKCSVDPANGAAGILTTSGRPYVPVSTSTVSHFIITVGTTALTASTAYQWIYRCGT